MAVTVTSDGRACVLIEQVSVLTQLKKMDNSFGSLWCWPCQWIQSTVAAVGV